MNAPYSSESAYPGVVAPEVPQGNRQAPSVPISVYRELATELRATQAMVDSLNQQNQQLTQQNQVLRQEMIRFADSAARLKQAIEVSQPQPLDMASGGRSPLESHFSAEAQAMAPAYPMALPSMPDDDEATASLPERLSESVGEGVSTLASQITQIVKKPKAKKSSKKPPQRPQAGVPQRLYTEERLDPNRPGQLSQRPSDLSGLWLAATILLIVISAFGAGFLIMKPLLNTSR
ncbi:hypothetical protein IQ265_03680 [Nodosilinea sp. LEGE 06152]|uniref:hypothetical protein n=1 Tax=Nodosilinea sp. LEGE 06152 TaxID=2777966 RepID=UPI001882D404|nr:hypothetical protein [Nodosilinea sp. LEGE 06152]MBE9155935.1 hypothetical protein [Nodosilinea sp. LEGE 06152]